MTSPTGVIARADGGLALGTALGVAPEPRASRDRATGDGRRGAAAAPRSAGGRRRRAQALGRLASRRRTATARRSGRTNVAPPSCRRGPLEPVADARDQVVVPTRRPRRARLERGRRGDRPAATGRARPARGPRPRARRRRRDTRATGIAHRGCSAPARNSWANRTRARGAVRRRRGTARRRRRSAITRTSQAHARLPARDAASAASARGRRRRAAARGDRAAS